MVRDEAGELGRGQVIKSLFVSVFRIWTLLLKQWEGWGKEWVECVVEEF